VIVDPMTRTPAFIRLSYLHIQTSGATPEEQAYDLLSRPFMVSFYGDREPRRHLRDPEVFAGVGGRTNVRFREYYAGVPVEGGRLTVTLFPNGIVDTITGRFVYFPHPRLVGAMTETAALAGAGPAYLDLVCGTDAACRADAAVENAADPPIATEVILSAELFIGTTLSSGQERLAYRVRYPRRVLYWDAISGGSLYDYATVHNAIPHVITNDEQNAQVEIVNGVPVTGITPDRDSTRTAAALASIDTTLTGMGRNGFDGRRRFIHRAGTRPGRERCPLVRLRRARPSHVPGRPDGDRLEPLRRRRDRP
jgi:hypothetical protein